jgi:uncharacterized protein with PQ loop repeat
MKQLNVVWFALVSFGGIAVLTLADPFGFSSAASLQRVGRALLWTSSVQSSSSAGLPVCNPTTPLTPTERIFGDISAWICFVMYFFGRIPQVWHNYKRKSVEGLSFFMFACAIGGNLCYGTSIVISGIDPRTTVFWENILPYLLGAYLCVIWPTVIVVQFYYYTRVYPKKQTMLHAYKPIP